MELGELGRENFRQYGELFLQKIRESWRLRAAVLASLAVCAVMALFVCADMADGQESRALSAGTIGDGGQPRGRAAEPVLGSGGGRLGNPFLPEHPDEGRQKLMRESHALADDGRQAPGRRGNGREEAAGRTVGERLAAVRDGAGGGISGGGKEAVGGQERTMQLQGIIRAGEGMGALLLIGSDARLLLAGEAVDGCRLEAVEQEEAVVLAGGTRCRLRIGERVSIGR